MPGSKGNGKHGLIAVRKRDGEQCEGHEASQAQAYVLDIATGFVNGDVRYGCLLYST